ATSLAQDIVRPRDSFRLVHLRSEHASRDEIDRAGRRARLDEKRRGAKFSTDHLWDDFEAELKMCELPSASSSSRRLRVPTDIQSPVRFAQMTTNSRGNSSTRLSPSEPSGSTPSTLP